MDECHHTDKLHPYASIMDFYSPPLKKPQVLGFSASPANGSSLVSVCLRHAVILVFMCIHSLHSAIIPAHLPLFSVAEFAKQRCLIVT